MKYFKLVASHKAPRYRITSENFNRLTKHKPPYEMSLQRNRIAETNNSISQYAICPSCLNPIQLIGLARRTEVKPYGKHTGKDIKGLPKWDIVKYQYCPYAVKSCRKKLVDKQRLPTITKEVYDLYELLKDQFDRVVYVVSNELGIKCSTAFWEESLKQYLANEMFCYPWLTESNLPYVFAYMGITHRNVYGQSFRVGSDVYNILKKYKHVNFTPTLNEKYERLISDGAFINLSFRLYDHRQRIDADDNLVETMMFCVDDLNELEYPDTGELMCKTVFEKKIIFRETCFMDTIRRYGENENRRYDLLKIAERLMPPLI